MSILWKLHHALRDRLPRRWIKALRSIIETSFDFPWRRVSYSQFGEDAVLTSLLMSEAWLRASREDSSASAIRLDRGFYVDVGAFAPKQYSNTYLFYKAGWRGINIDATPGSMKVFRRVRPRDINLEVAVSDEEREMTFYSWGGPSVCNTLNAEHAAKFEVVIGRPPEKTLLRTRTLGSILDEHLPAGEALTFFSIDAEEHTLEVLRSNDWARYAPRYVIVEIDVDDIDTVRASTTTTFLEGLGYRMRAWVGASVIFHHAPE